jgi:hypothetical protein
MKIIVGKSLGNAMGTFHTKGRTKIFLAIFSSFFGQNNVLEGLETSTLNISTKFVNLGQNQVKARFFYLFPYK